MVPEYFRLDEVSTDGWRSRDTERTTPSQHRGWQQAIRQGLVLVVLVVLGWVVVPADHPAQIAVVFGGVYAAFLLPTALYFGYQGGNTTMRVQKIVCCRSGLRGSKCQCNS
ncbi:hypothetical protein ACH9L7_13835 [Haloferax sp. S1W]|uniref:hypothetical protein n=1 Tax=Haloferax sp. S1W TaxID=3377110 RepID=UPI0037CBF9FF